MMRRSLLILLIAVLILGGLTSQALGQEDRAVREVEESELTPELLIELLSPQGGQAREPGVRDPVARGLKESSSLRCNRYRPEASRGLTVAPIGQIVALSILFPFDSAELTAQEESKLDRVGEALSSPQLSGYCFQIEGHTDSIGEESYNLELSKRRALRVKQYLVTNHSIDPDRIVLVGYGELKPIASNVSEEGRHRNRRVQFVNLGAGG